MSASTEPDDDTMGDIFRAHAEARQAKRAQNREESTRILREAGLTFTEHNHGAHLIVAGRWDFTPGTGRFCERKGAKGGKLREGRGVMRLLALIAQDGSP